MNNMSASPKLKVPSLFPGKAWQQVLARDAAADGQFVYAVKTTKIFCRPSCPSRRPDRKNVTFFPTPEPSREAPATAPASAANPNPPPVVQRPPGRRHRHRLHLPHRPRQPSAPASKTLPRPPVLPPHHPPRLQARPRRQSPRIRQSPARRHLKEKVRQPKTSYHRRHLRRRLRLLLPRL